MNRYWSSTTVVKIQTQSRQTYPSCIHSSLHNKRHAVPCRPGNACVCNVEYNYRVPNANTDVKKLVRVLLFLLALAGIPQTRQVGVPSCQGSIHTDKQWRKRTGWSDYSYHSSLMNTSSFKEWDQPTRCWSLTTYRDTIAQWCNGFGPVGTTRFSAPYRGSISSPPGWSADECVVCLRWWWWGRWRWWWR